MTYTTKDLEAKGIASAVLEMRKWRRHTARLTQGELAQLLHISRNFVEKVELGLVPMPRAWLALLEHLRASWTEAMRPTREKRDGRGRYRRHRKGQPRPADERCTGCDGPIERCGPALWAQQRKCCPDCSHVAPCTAELASASEARP